MPRLAIGKNAKPRAFKNSPVMYQTNKKAWVRGDIFESEIRYFDCRMRNETWKIAMMVANCLAQPQILLENVGLIFFLPNTMSVTQPMGAGSIKNLKFHYRRILVGRRLAAAENAENGQDWTFWIVYCLWNPAGRWSNAKLAEIVWRRPVSSNNLRTEVHKRWVTLELRTIQSSMMMMATRIFETYWIV